MSDFAERTATPLNRRQALRLSIAAGATLLAAPLVQAAPAREPAPADPPQHAVDRFLKSLNCSQAVLETFAPQLGMPVGQARRVAAAFAGGMGMGAECGAVTGAFLVIGLRHGKTSDHDATADGRTFAQVAAFVEAFKARHGHLDCSELLGTDMGTPEGVKTAADRGLFTSACPRFVRSAVEILEELSA